MRLFQLQNTLGVHFAFEMVLTMVDWSRRGHFAFLSCILLPTMQAARCGVQAMDTHARGCSHFLQLHCIHGISLVERTDRWMPGAILCGSRTQTDKHAMRSLSFLPPHRTNRRGIGTLPEVSINLSRSFRRYRCGRHGAGSFLGRSPKPSWTRSATSWQGALKAPFDDDGRRELPQERSLEAPPAPACTVVPRAARIRHGSRGVRGVLGLRNLHQHQQRQEKRTLNCRNDWIEWTWRGTAKKRDGICGRKDAPFKHVRNSWMMVVRSGSNCTGECIGRTKSCDGEVLVQVAYIPCSAVDSCWDAKLGGRCCTSSSCTNQSRVASEPEGAH